MEAGVAFEQLPSGQCPVCGHKPDESDGTGAVDKRLLEFQASSRAEVAKIELLSRDLATSLSDIQGEDAALAVRQDQLEAHLKDADLRLKKLLHGTADTADDKLSTLIKVQSRLVEATSIYNEMASLTRRYAAVEEALKAKAPRVKIPPKVETRTVARFADVVAQTLKLWRYPNLGSVSFDPNRFDLVIGDQNRGSMGKGYRALTHAAVIVSLLRYCRQEGLPHTGLVVLDTPLNPFRGPDDVASEFVNQDVQNAFYEDLATNSGGDQIVVLENTEPPVKLRGTMNYIHFSGTKGKERYGYFPG